MSTQSSNLESENLGFDIDALRAKYEEERLKRLRQDGNAQFITGADNLTEYEGDPYTDRTEREPRHDFVDVVIIGAGFSGLITGASLREAGVENIRYVDEAGDFGGTWYWNRYPGLIVDVDAYVYLPQLEKTGYMPTQKYPRGYEVREYIQLFARHYDLYKDTCFQTTVKELRWDETSACWIVSTDRGDHMRARHVVNALGPNNRIRLPRISGIDNFKGHKFHACRWDYEYTGGDEKDPELTGLKGKKVSVVGTAATAVQVVPEIAKFADHLYVVQRTPSCMNERGQASTNVEWWNSLEPGWQDKRKQNFNILALGGNQDEDLVDDAWTRLGKALSQVLGGAEDEGLSAEDAALKAEFVDFKLMESIRNRVDDYVDDPEVAEKLKPYFYYACKRPNFSDTYLPTFNRSNVTLVDTNGKGIEEITESGFVVQGVEHEVDCIIFASGFEFGTSYLDTARYDLIGRQGQKLSNKWAKGMRTLHGIFADGFPNCYFVGMTQSTASPNFVYVFERLAQQVAAVIGEAFESGMEIAEVSQEAVDEWVEIIDQSHDETKAFLAKCTPGQYNNEGDLDDPDAAANRLYGGGCEAFLEILREWREKGTFEGMRFERPGKGARKSMYPVHT